MFDSWKSLESITKKQYKNSLILYANIRRISFLKIVSDLKKIELWDDLFT